MVSVSVIQIPKQKTLYTGLQIVVNKDLQTFYVIVVTTLQLSAVSVTGHKNCAQLCCPQAV